LRLFLHLHSGASLAVARQTSGSKAGVYKKTAGIVAGRSAGVAYRQFSIIVPS